MRVYKEKKDAVRNKIAGMTSRLLLTFILMCFTTKISCEQSTSHNTDTEIKGFKHPDCPATDSTDPILLPHPKFCTKFYVCSNGLAYEKKCMHDLHFNPRLRVCDYEESALCSRRGEVEATSPKCPKGNKGLAVHLPHENSCEFFYTCNFGKTILNKCPKGLHFNAKESVCDYPDRAECSSETKVTTTNEDLLNETDTSTILRETDSGASDTEPTQNVTKPIATTTTRAPKPKPSPLCPVIDSKFPHFFRHDTNCSIYYMCGNGFAHEFVCPDDLHFNLKLNVCDYPLNSTCEKETTGLPERDNAYIVADNNL